MSENRSAAGLAFEGIDAPYVQGMQLVRDYDAIQEVLRSDVFEQGAFELSGPALLEGSVVLLHGREHFDRRRMYAHLFSRSALQRYLEDHLVPMIDHVLESRVAVAEDGVARAELVDLTWHMLCRVAGSVTGLDGLDEPAVLERLVEYTRAFGRGLTVEWLTEDADDVLRATRAARDEFEADLFGASVARRRDLVGRFEQGELPESELPLDLITVLLRGWQPEWDEELLIREATLFLVAATQTTGQAFPQFILHLEDWIDGDPERRARTIADPELLAHAAFESLRLFVASPVRIRRAREDITLSTGQSVRAGERVGLLLQAANTDPAVFGDNADDYDPDRDVDRRSQWGLAFGGGPHMCIGRPLVTGSFGGNERAEGTMATMARRLYALGMTLDPARAPIRDESTFHPAYSSVPVVLGALPREETS